MSATPGGRDTESSTGNGTACPSTSPSPLGQRVSRTRNDPNMAMEDRKCQMSWSSKKSRRMQSRLCSRDSAGVFWARAGRAACPPRPGSPAPSRALPVPSPWRRPPSSCLAPGPHLPHPRIGWFQISPCLCPLHFFTLILLPSDSSFL